MEFFINDYGVSCWERILTFSNSTIKVFLGNDPQWKLHNFFTLEAFPDWLIGVYQLLSSFLNYKSRPTCLLRKKLFLAPTQLWWLMLTSHCTNLTTRNTELSPHHWDSILYTSISTSSSWTCSSTVINWKALLISLDNTINVYRINSIHGFVHSQRVGVQTDQETSEHPHQININIRQSTRDKVESNLSHHSNRYRVSYKEVAMIWTFYFFLGHLTLCRLEK